MKAGRILIIAVICMITQLLFAQQKDSGLNTSVTATKVNLPIKHRYLSLSFDLTAGMTNESGWKNPKGITMSYIISPAKRYKPSQYYVGLLLSIAGKSLETPYSAPGITNGKISWSYSTLSFSLTQRYFFKSTSNAIPFVDFDLGWRSSDHSVHSEYDRYSKFLGYYHSGNDIYETQVSAFSAGLGVGLYFQVIGLTGPYIKFGLTTGNKSSVMMPHSGVIAETNSTFLSVSLGFML